MSVDDCRSGENVRTETVWSEPNVDAAQIRGMRVNDGHMCLSSSHSMRTLPKW